MVTATQTIDEALAGLAAQHRREYVATARQVAQGKAIDAKRIAPVCAKAEKTLDEFRTLVARMRDRIEATSKIVAADKLDAAARRASAKVGPLNAEIEAIQREYDEKLRDLHSRRSQALSESTSGGRKAAELRREAMEVLKRTAEDADGDVRDLHNVRIDDTPDEARMAAAKSAPIGPPSDKPHVGPPPGSYPTNTYTPSAKS